MTMKKYAIQYENTSFSQDDVNHVGEEIFNKWDDVAKSEYERLQNKENICNVRVFTVDENGNYLQEIDVIN